MLVRRSQASYWNAVVPVSASLRLASVPLVNQASATAPVAPLTTLVGQPRAS